MKQVYIIGMGPGSRKCLTQQASEAIEHADVIIGSKRLLWRLIVTQIKTFCCYSQGYLRYYKQRKVFNICSFNVR